MLMNVLKWYSAEQTTDLSHGNGEPWTSVVLIINWNLIIAPELFRINRNFLVNGGAFRHFVIRVIKGIL